MANPVINVSLAVFPVGSGGNTRDGRYFYSFTPAIIEVSKADTEVLFTLSPETSASCSIADIYYTIGADTDLYGKTKASDGRSIRITNSNKHHQLIFLSVLVLDGTTRVNCDPQMTNTPGV